VHLETRGAPGSVHAAWAKDVGVLLGYLVLGVVLYWRAWRSHPATWMQLGGDQWRNVWFLQWTPWSILHGHSPLYSGAANVPGGVNILLNAGAPLLGVLFSPVTLLFGPVAAFNAASTLALPLSAAAAYALIRRFTNWRPAAVAGGLLYGFGPAEVVHGLEGHVNLAFAPLVPLIFLALHELVLQQRGNAVRWGVGLGLLVAAEFFVSAEVVLETVVVGALVVALAAVNRYREVVRARAAFAAKGLAWAGGTAAVLLAGPVWIMARGLGHISGPVQLVAQVYRANLIAPFIPDSRQLIVVHSLRSTADHFAGSTAENGSYLGIPLLLLLAGGLIWLRRDPVVQVGSAGAALAFVLSLGGALHVRGTPAISASGAATGSVPLPEAVLYKVPLLENLIPARFALQATLLLAIVGAVILSRLHEQLRARLRPAWSATGVPVALALVALIPLLPSGLAAGIGPNGTPAGFTAVARTVPAGAVAVVFPFPTGAFPEPSMWQAATKFRFRMPGGSFFVPQTPASTVAFSQALGGYTYVSRTAEIFTEVGQASPPAETAAVRSALSAEWRAWRVAAVIAVPDASADPAASRAFLTWLLGSPTTQAGSTLGWTGRTLAAGS
jgi:hypothetical protein